MFYWLSRLFLYISCKIILGYRVIGQENIPPEGGVIFCSNHLSYLDPPFFAPAVGINAKQTNFMGRDTLFKNFFFRQLITALKCFPVRRGGADRQSWREFENRINQGKRILLFPEGTRSSDGKLGKANAGAGMLISRCKNAQIVPVRLFGPEKIWPKGKGVQGRFPITVVFGPPIDLREELKAKGSREVYQAISDKVMAGIGELKESA